MPPDEILSFLRNPRDFAKRASDAAVWLDGLEAIVIPGLAAAGGDPLLRAQEAAWRGLADQRTGLILGPPGTGKTYLLSWLISGYMQARKKAGLPCRVFVSAFTRNAVGNVLDAVAKRHAMFFPGAPRPLFLGNPPSAGLSSGVDQVGSDKEVLSSLKGGYAVVGGTVWGLYNLLASKGAPGDGVTAPLFDLICLDEASQMVLGQGLMALAGIAEDGRIIVAGDDRQLPPIRALRSTIINDRELGGSLYAFLKSTGVAEFALEETFRLNRPLTAFPEKSFYPGRYRSTVPERRLPLREGWEAGLEPWARVALDPEAPIVVFLHDGPSAATSSPFEARLTSRLVDALQSRILHEDGVCPPEAFWSDVAAVVSPHRAQNALIRSILPEALKPSAFVETVDRIQGKEREAIFLSYCVSDPEFALAEGEFIFSPERLNVAVTRGRSKLVLFVSRKLLEAAPNDQETMDKVELLREFIYDCEHVGELLLDGPAGTQVRTELRVRGFVDTPIAFDLSAPPETAKAVDLPPMTQTLEELLAAIQRLSASNRYGSPTLTEIRRDMALPEEPFSACRDLHRLGLIVLGQRASARGSFWVARYLAEPRRVFEPDLVTVRERIGEVIRETRRGTLAPFYDKVRDRFAWMTAEREDGLLPVLQKLEAEGLVRLSAVNNSWTVDLTKSAAEPLPDDDVEPLPALSDVDFQVLNRLEDLEARQINFGIFDGWTHPATLARSLRRSANAVTSTIARLDADGQLLVAQDGRVRSRMAELARELRYVKQRFAPGDAGRRPYLIRSLKLELRERNKPVRNVNLDDLLDRLSKSAPEQAVALTGLGEMLRSQWGAKPKIAGFQARALERVLAAWRGEGDEALVISADTGSGKTEAALLPMMAAAATDWMNGVRGVRAVLTYPRVRLVANQAQRLAGYLSALAQVPGMPVLTLGMQVAQVPRSFERLASWDREAGWEDAGPGRLAFPFFGCPNCAQGLHLIPGAGQGADALDCPTCAWRFEGWVGSKDGLVANPPSFFMPTTDSLHGWMNDPQYGALFGDHQYAPPRVMMADEIHLYTHIHGAQVGLTLRRLLARAKVNGDARPVAVGMSATLGDPARSWGRLLARENVSLVRPEADELEINPQGREYFYFVQPEVESRGRDVAGPSATIQTMMCLSHGMRRRAGTEGGFRSLVFLDSIDKVRRLHSAYMDAEEGKALFDLRTAQFGDDAAGHPMVECCGEPQGCDRFGDGECWWFAARDTRQRTARGRLPPDAPLKVAPSPIFSGTGGSAEKLIKGSDVIFATSSLEVGYDDPDITLVYQHYAPANLASFIQRKGRGGRGVSDRPITGVTLSIYSPRDSWWFRRPAGMISPVGFETPLNPDNFFVRRGQALCALLDGFARRAAQGRPIFCADGPTDEALAEAERLVIDLMGDRVWAEFGFVSARAFWVAALASGEFTPELAKLRQNLDWAPGALFDTINLPSARVSTEEGRTSDRGLPREDISLLLPTAAPGNATRRFSGSAVHWVKPVQGKAPWLDKADYALALSERLSMSGEDLLDQLPAEARPALAGLQPRICRPVQVSLERLGRVSGTDFMGEWSCDPAGPSLSKTTGGRDPRGVNHESRGELRGFLLIEANDETVRRPPFAPVAPWLSDVQVHIGGSTGDGRTGLLASRVFWGADAELRLEEPGSDAVAFAQTFVSPSSGEPLLHGYRVETEGVRFFVHTERLDAFVAAESQRLKADEPERRWRLSQFTRFLVESRAQYLGVNTYEARRGADLIVAAAGDPILRPKLVRLLDMWDPSRLAEFFEETRATRLAQHPLMTARRVERTAKALGTASFKDLVKEALEEVKRPGALDGYIRSLVLHSLAVRLKEAFVRHGRGEDRRVLTHLKLPIQFGGVTEDVITICESGASGDGTTRGFADAFEPFLREWTDGALGACPNAAEDALVEAFWKASRRHADWREADPNSLTTVAMLAAELGLGSETPVPAMILRVLFGRESIGAEDIDLYDLASEIEQVRAVLEAQLGRKAQDWELTTAVVAAAQAGEQAALSRLLTAYSGMEDAVPGESLGPEARLADQVFRIGARLCVDGCRACVHQGSDLMSDSLAEVSVSRRVLQRFLAS